ncbi:hypothetical protein HDK90DRAFT_510435 [Phyllosticta capitalensis]|uniref:Uncharacterized protein n=1 Tax=Phyllosticta capitalensis TaxID=121624 RepID=A0ABR1YPK3_9PEZI
MFVSGGVTATKMNSFDEKTPIVTIQFFPAPESDDMAEYVPTTISEKRLKVPLSLVIPQTLQPQRRSPVWDEEAQVEMLDEYRGSLQWVTGVLLIVGLLVLAWFIRIALLAAAPPVKLHAAIIAP